MGISKELTGTPWHVEKMHRAEGDNKRHRSRCVYYNAETKQCSKLHIKCFGSAHCTSYREQLPESESQLSLAEIPKKNKPNRHKRIIVDSKNKICPSSCFKFIIGDKVKHARFGEGTITKILDDGVLVKFKFGVKKIHLFSSKDSKYQARDAALRLIKPAQSSKRDNDEM